MRKYTILATVPLLCGFFSGPTQNLIVCEFGERPFAKEIAEAKTQSKPKEKESSKKEVEDAETVSKSEETESSKEEIAEAKIESKSKETESPEEEIKEENSK